MKTNKMFGKIALILMFVLLVGCNSGAEENTESSVDKNVQGKVYTKNTLRQLMVTGNPKSIVTKLTFIDDDAWGEEQMEASGIASAEFYSWYKGEIFLDENAYITAYGLTSNSKIDYSYDENGLRLAEFVINGSVARLTEEKLEGEYIAEYMSREGSDHIIMAGKYVKDENGLIIKKLECPGGRDSTYDKEYEYEDGNLRKIINTSDGVYTSSIEIEYDIFPIKLTMNNSDDLKLVYTFDYEFDEEGNWIKCNKYEEDKLIVTYERTIEY